MCLPSGETAGDPAPIWREMIRSASSACLLDAAGSFIVLTLVGAQRGAKVMIRLADYYCRLRAKSNTDRSCDALLQ